MDRIRKGLYHELRTGFKSYLFHSVEELREATLYESKALDFGRRGVQLYSSNPLLIKGSIILDNKDCTEEERLMQLEEGYFDEVVSLEEELEKQMFLNPHSIGDDCHKMHMGCDFDLLFPALRRNKYSNLTEQELSDKIFTGGGLTIFPIIQYERDYDELELIGCHQGTPLPIKEDKPFWFLFDKY